MKKKCQIILLLLAFPFIASSQTIDDMCKIVIGVKFQNGISQETEYIQPQLEDKLINFASQAGCSSYGDCAFFISPNIVVNSVDVAEGGMKNVYIVEGDLYLSILDNHSGTVFSTKSFPFRGTATKKEIAVRNGVLNIRFDNVSSLFTEAKSKILLYFKNRKDAIFARANTCASSGDYDGAIACLMMIPEDLTDLYEQALLKAQYIYQLRDQAYRLQIIAEQKDYNDSILTAAKSYLSMHQPEAALNALSSFAPGNETQDKLYRNYCSQAEAIITARERETKRKEERIYLDEKRREDRAYQEQAKQAAHQRNMDRQSMNLKKQMISAAERVEHHKLNISEQKVRALKQIACDYIRNNPNKVDYIRVRF